MKAGKIQALITLLSLLLGLLAGCNYTIPRHSEENPGNNRNRSDQGTEAPDFALVQEKVFRPHCVRCHGLSGGVSLESYEQVRLHLDRIQAAVISGSMPPSGPLPTDVNDLLFAWIEAGAPRTIEERPKPPIQDPNPPEEPGPPADPALPLEPTFTSINQNILAAKCLGCHGGERRAGGVALEMRDDLLQLIDFEEPKKSDLIEVLVAEEGRPPMMPPARTNIPPVSANQIEIIIEWIEKSGPA